MSLQGKKLLVTRAKAQASALVLQIKKYGGIPVEVPLITFIPVMERTKVNQAIKELQTFDWLVFTSKNGIDYFFKYLVEVNGDTSLPAHCKIAVVGSKTEEALNEYGYKANLVPNYFVAESLAEKLLTVLKHGEKVLIPKGNLARHVIATQLSERNIEVCELDVYETTIETSSKERLYQIIKNKQCDMVTFTSSSTVDHFVQLLEGTDWRTYIDHFQYVSIGPITSRTMEKHGIPVHYEPEEYTIHGMLNCVMDKLKEENSC